MKIVEDWPPNIESIREVLPVSDRNIFAYDHVIYNPGGNKLGEELLAHECVHFEQQDKFDGGVAGWWEKFLAEPVFRLDQEIAAHRVEYRVWCGMKRRPRNHRRVMLKNMAKRLAAPMYGGIISVGKAKRAISE